MFMTSRLDGEEGRRGRGGEREEAREAGRGISLAAATSAAESRAALERGESGGEGIV